MKRQLAAVLTGVFIVSALVTGCEQSTGLETDEITISQYKGIEVAQVDAAKEATDEDVENSIQSALQSRAEEKEVKDRAVQDGDITNIDFVGKIDGEAFDGGSAEGYDLTIGSGAFIEGFEDSVIGHKIGETFDWNGKFPDNYGNTDLAGKDVTFTITVNSIKESIVPELTDDLVAELSQEAKTVDEYKKEVKDNLTEQNQAQYDNQITSEVWDAIMENTEVKKYPDGKVDEVKQQVTDNYQQMADSYGMEFADLLTQMGMTEEQFEEQASSAAEQSVKMQLITEAIAEKEKIELDDATYEEELQKIVDNYGYESVDAIKETIDEEELRMTVLNVLVGDWLVENCVQKAE